MTIETHPIFAQLACLKRQQEALEPNRHIAARTLKEQAVGLVEAWFDGQDANWLSNADDADQVAAARAHVSATLARITKEIEEGAPF